MTSGIAEVSGDGVSVGGRVAFDIGKESWGFTPLFNQGLVRVGRDTTFFSELDLPIRFKQDASELFRVLIHPEPRTDNRR